MPRRSQTNRVPGIPHATFKRIVEELASDVKSDLRFQKPAIAAMHQAAEAYLEKRFSRAGDLARLCKLDTVRPDHLQSAQD